MCNVIVLSNFNWQSFYIFIFVLESEVNVETALSDQDTTSQSTEGPEPLQVSEALRILVTEKCFD